MKPSGRFGRPISFTTGATVALVAALLAIGPGTTPAVAATYDVDQVQDVVDELFRVQPTVASADYNGAAQTVTVGIGGELTAVELPLSRDDFTTRELVIEIRDGNPDGAVLAASEPIPADAIPEHPDSEWLLVPFLVRPVLTSGQVIAIVIPTEPVSETSDPAWYWGKASSDVYAGGVAYGGVIGGPWQEYEDGSDFAFVTYMRNGEATCDLSLALETGDWIDDALTALVGEDVYVGGFDFPPNVEVTIAFEPEGGTPIIVTDMADAFGEFEGYIAFEAQDVGPWTVSAWPTDNIECADVVALTIVAAPPPTATPTAMATATPTASVTASASPTQRASVTPVPTAAALPDTATQGASASTAVGMALAAVMALAGGVAAYRWRRMA